MKALKTVLCVLTAFAAQAAFAGCHNGSCSTTKQNQTVSSCATKKACCDTKKGGCKKKHDRKRGCRRR